VQGDALFDIHGAWEAVFEDNCLAQGRTARGFKTATFQLLTGPTHLNARLPAVMGASSPYEEPQMNKQTYIQTKNKQTEPKKVKTSTGSETFSYF
jgi:hypothetical protein